MNIQPDISNVNIVTVSGQYGSSSDKIATLLAARLRWRLIGDNIKRLVADKLGLPEEEVAVHDQHMYSFADRFLLCMAATTIEMCPDLECVALATKTEPLYHAVQQQMIREIAQTGNVVIVGRGSQVILADQYNVLHVRVIAPLEQRVHYVMQREQLDAAHAQALLRRKDRALAYYYTSLHGRAVSDPLLYDLVINGGAFNLENQVDLICQALRQKDYQSDNMAEQWKIVS